MKLNINESLKEVSNDFIRKHRMSIVVLVLTTISVTLPAFLSKGAYPSGIDTPAHIFKVELMQNMLAEYGKIFNWTDRWYSGYPFLTLYAPLSFYIWLAIDLILKDFVLSYNILRASTLFFTGLIVYFIVDRETSDKISSLSASILTITAYPLYNNLFTIGRIAFATGIVFYLAVIYFLLDERIYTEEINSRHVVFGFLIGLLVIAHPMSAYLMVYTGFIYLFVYRERVIGLGLKPFLLTGLIAAIISLPYAITFLQHSAITDPSWIRQPLSLTQLPFLVVRRFGDILPQYIGSVHAGAFIVGVISLVYARSKFLKFALLNFLLFFIFFWSGEFNFLQYIPFGAQFDFSRFQAFFTLYAVIIGGFGLDEIRSTLDLDIKLLAILFILLLAADLHPMVEESANWNPKFENDLSSLPVNNSHNAMTVGMRHWDDYFVPIEMEVSNTMGWFQQSDPHYNFTQTLQNTGGVWYPIDLKFPRKKDPMLRKNLMQLSNTKYIIFGKDWAPERAKGYLLGNYVPLHRKNKDLLKQTREDEEFSTIYNSSALEIHELKKELALCRTVDPVWIKDNYFIEARTLLSSDKAFPKVPVHSDVKDRGNMLNGSVSCVQQNPYTIEIETTKPSWVLVSQSYYPFWRRASEKEIYDAFGFMVTHVNGTGELIYDQGKGGLRS